MASAAGARYAVVDRAFLSRQSGSSVSPVGLRERYRDQTTIIYELDSGDPTRAR